MILIAIDPGLRHCGVAVFEAGELQCAALVKNRDLVSRGPSAHAEMAWQVLHWLSAWDLDRAILVLEWPRIYPGSGQRKGDLNDLLELAGVDSAIASKLGAFLGEVTCYAPAQWKGQVPKRIMNDRVLKRLTPREAARIIHPKDHNVLDAIGIGLHRLERLDRKVIAR